MHDLVIVGVPLLAILAGILFSRSDVKDLRAEMKAGFDRVEARFNRIEDRFNKVEDHFNRVEDHLGRIDSDLKQFYHLTGKLEARMDAIDDKRK